MLFTFYNFKFSVSSNFTVISACSILSTSFLKSISGSQIEDGCDALFSIAIFRNCGFRVIIKIFVIFVCLQSGVFRGKDFLTNFSFLTASCLIVSFGILRISLHKILWCCLFFTESNIFEVSCVNFSKLI